MFYLLSHDEKYLELRNLKRKADPDDILSFFHATKNLRLPSRYNEVYLDIFASEFE